MSGKLSIQRVYIPAHWIERIGLWGQRMHKSASWCSCTADVCISAVGGYFCSEMLLSKL